MKKLLVLLAVGAIAGCVLAQVYSQNVVGYAKVDLPEDTFVLASTPFIASNTVENLFGDLPTGSQLVFWENNSWVAASKTARLGWGTAATKEIELGSAVFVKVPIGSAVTNVVFSGDVLLDEDFPLQSIDGYSLFSFPFAAEVEWGETTLATDAETGARFITWGPAGWTAYSKTARLGWGAGANVKLELGKGFFFESTNTVERLEDRPYDPAEW